MNKNEPMQGQNIPAYDWQKIGAELDQFGATILENIISPQDCREIAAGYHALAAFRTVISMRKHGFGRGEYKYYANPIPALIWNLRQKLYFQLAPIANRWSERLGSDVRFPPTHDAFLERCHAAGQTRPTPLILQYVEGDYNCLHQDIYGDIAFPLQVAILLSEPEKDFTGGEFVLTEQRPRMQSRAEVVPLRQGDGVVFAVNDRPMQGTRGDYRVKMRHGVSRIRSGKRHTLGIIFHDSR
ncbi:2OG-Fe(II) oxygenase [Brucella intermedia]|uniref:2OG-Fe(II) oxygenase n=1 Tax=Brucella intermedia TaxID=94625 RepID=UPI002361B6D5|nr:2OG-Fe(II) oxygenase [Brucella intermedia]